MPHKNENQVVGLQTLQYKQFKKYDFNFQMISSNIVRKYNFDMLDRGRGGGIRFF